MTSAPRPEADVGPKLAGTSLVQYAAVVAALAEGFTLEAVLAAEGVRDADWRRAAWAWRKRLVEQAATKDGGGLFEQYEKELGAAEDRLGRSVEPLDEDLGAWLTFTRMSGVEPEPVALLDRLGLTMNDVARLRRRWVVRMAADEGLRKQAEENAKGATPELPAIRVGVAVLRPSPAAMGQALEPERAGAGERSRDAVALLDRVSAVVPTVQVPTYLLGQAVDALASEQGAPASATDATCELPPVPPVASRRAVVPFAREPADAVSSTRTAAEPARAAPEPTMVLPCFTAEPTPSASPSQAVRAPKQAEVDRTLRGGLHRSAIVSGSGLPDRRARGL
jgi:hypothetical protein